MTELKVRIVASTTLHHDNLEETGYVFQYDRLRDSEPEYNWGFTPGEEDAYEAAFDAWAKNAMPKCIDELHEASGRRCYNSWHRPNPATAENRDYLGVNIIGKGHFSVLAHGHVSLHVQGVSRALLLELERHSKKSHLNFSVISQRYVDHGYKSGVKVVMPPLFDEDLRFELAEAMADAQANYDNAYAKLREAGHTVKEARGAARAFLPENTETRFVVTASIRGWRDVLEQRLPETADAEIREFAMAVLKELVKVAPNSVQDFAEEYLSEEK